MPGTNGTGPMGQGAGTGRGMGPCGAGLGRGRGAGQGMGYGAGCGMGRGRHGRRNQFRATGLPGWARSGVDDVMPSEHQAPEHKLAILKQQAEYLGRNLDDIRDRIQKLETQPTDA